MTTVVALVVSGCGVVTGPDPDVEQRATATGAQPEATENSGSSATAKPESGRRENLDQSTGLEQYVEWAREQIPDLLELSDGLYTEINVWAVYPGTVEYEYFFDQQVDPVEAVAHVESLVEEMQRECDEEVLPTLRRRGVRDDVEVRYTYFNADGSTAWTGAFTPST